jgi:hypothetical protein
MSEYGMSLPAAMRFPLIAYHALIPCIQRRNGVELPSHDDPAVRAAMDARQKCYAWLRRHFRVLEPGEPGPDNALGAWMAARQNFPAT